MTRFFQVLALAGVALGQVIGPSPFPAFPPVLKDYLGLSPTQVDGLVRIDSELNQYYVDKVRRMAELQQTIAAETAKDTPDAMVIGQSYVELEQIRRDISRRDDELRVQRLAALNDAQKAKLKTLEDALKLQPVISAAVCEGLLVQPPAVGLQIIPNVPAQIIRNGDFSGLISDISSSLLLPRRTGCALAVFTPGTPPPQQP